MGGIKQAEPNDVALLLTIAMSATHNSGNAQMNLRLRKYAEELGFTDDTLVSAAKKSELIKLEAVH